MLNFPELVKIPDDAISQVPELFKIFKRDFIDNVTYFMAYPVIIPRPREGEIYPEIFWHIISMLRISIRKCFCHWQQFRSSTFQDYMVCLYFCCLSIRSSHSNGLLSSSEYMLLPTLFGILTGFLDLPIS